MARHAPPAGRILAVDVGTRQTGFAVSDPTRTIAQPLDTIRVESLSRLAEAVHELVARYDVSLVVVGLPLYPDGRESPGCARVRALAARIGESGVEIVLVDERDTTNEAEEVLGWHGKRRRERRDAVDRIAAALILRRYLQTVGQAGPN